MTVQKKQKSRMASSAKSQKKQEKNDAKLKEKVVSESKLEKFAKGGKEVENNKEADKAKERASRLKIASSGEIPDARVFQLAYLEKCAVEADLQIQVRKSAYETRIQVLRNELNGIVRQWEATQKRSLRKIKDIRRDIEEDYGIVLSQWGYNDETGVLEKLPPDVVELISKRKKDESDFKSEKESPSGNAPG